MPEPKTRYADPSLTEAQLVVLGVAAPLLAMNDLPVTRFGGYVLGEPRATAAHVRKAGGLGIVDEVQTARSLPPLRLQDLAWPARGRDLPAIFLTARQAEAERVLGLELGADDYVAKPFSPRELVARLRAILRRASRTGRASQDERSARQWCESLDVVLQRSERAWGVRTLGL